MTYASFIKLYPGFNQISPDLVIEKINEATLSETAAFWGEERDYAIGVMVAARLTDDHVGEHALLTPSDKQEGSNKYWSDYYRRRKRRIRSKHCGFVLL